jgi:hypothetical protein
MPDDTSGDFRGFGVEERQLSGALCECGHDYVEHRLPGRECQAQQRVTVNGAGYERNCRCQVFIRETPDDG